RIRYGMLHALPEASAQPLAHGRPETHLATVNDLIGNQPRDRLLQKMLRDSATHLMTHGYTVGELDEMMVEKRHACLDASRHPYLVNAHQQEFRQPQFEFVVDHARQRIRVRLRAK